MRAQEAEIHVVPFEEFKKHITNNRPALDEKIKYLEKEIESEKSVTEKMKKDYLDLANVMARAGGTLFNMNTLGGQFLHNEREKHMTAANDVLEKSKKDIDNQSRKIKDLQNEIEYLKEGKHGPTTFTRKLMDGSIKTKTNSNGEFNLKLKSDVNYIILAEKSDMYWFIPLKANEKLIKLNNNNATRTFCTICGPNSKWPE
jgi:septation ring formation regulator EzrA